MAKTVTATEAKNRLGSFINEVQKEGETVIIENRGTPAAVITSFQDYEELQAFRAERSRLDALATLREIQNRVFERNQDLTDEEADRIADEVVRDAVQRMVDKGQIRFVKP